MAIWYILWPFGIFYGHLVYSVAYFTPFWYVVQRKIWQPLSARAQEQFTVKFFRPIYFAHPEDNHCFCLEYAEKNKGCH
jgi:hypothetical protein